jgi:hypothetical protein
MSIKATGGIPIGMFSGSDSVDALHKSLKEFNEKTSAQTNQLILLTWVIAILTLVMTIGVGVQIWLAHQLP